MTAECGLFQCSLITNCTPHKLVVCSAAPWTCVGFSSPPKTVLSSTQWNRHLCMSYYKCREAALRTETGLDNAVRHALQARTKSPVFQSPMGIGLPSPASLMWRPEVRQRGLPYFVKRHVPRDAQDIDVHVSKYLYKHVLEHWNFHTYSSTQYLPNVFYMHWQTVEH